MLVNDIPNEFRSKASILTPVTTRRVQHCFSTRLAVSFPIPVCNPGLVGGGGRRVARMGITRVSGKPRASQHNVGVNSIYFLFLQPE
jgi:hypothetical protein